MKVRSRSANGQTGQAAVLLIGVLLVAVAFVGVAVDGARMFTARRDLSSLADSAALAGASLINVDVYRASLGRDLQVDEQGARAAVAAVIQRAGLPAGTQLDVRVDAASVDVRIDRPVATTFLRAVGLVEQRIGAHAKAAPRRN